ncbi:MAG: iron-containing alcohol dehydrogenase [Deltaproteobacteria bacterium]|nr:iron-containing alcohol dehydrogenase [Deltaproteobacteria bacterium]
MTEKPIILFASNSIIFGNNALEQLKPIISKVDPQHILVITDKGLVRCGLVKRLENVLQSFKYSLYDDIEETPDIVTIRKITEMGRREKFDLLIGFGGGSPMDAAKAVSALLTNEGDIEDYLGSDTIRIPGVKKILVPTTSGTGSEATIFSVLAKRDQAMQEPTGISDQHLLPEWSIVDPTLTVVMPPALTANTGMDAFSHAAECFVSNKSNFLTEPLALDAIKLISRNIEQAFFHGRDLVARSNMSAGSLLAGMAISQIGTGGLAHALAETIQIPYQVPHGMAIAVLLPHVMAFNLPARPDKYALVAEAMGVDSHGLSETELAEKSVERVKNICALIGLPRNLAALGVHEHDLDKIARVTMIIGKGYFEKNPRRAGMDDLLGILQNAFMG